MGLPRPDSPALVAAHRDPFTPTDPNIASSTPPNINSSTSSTVLNPVNVPPRPDSPAPVQLRNNPNSAVSLPIANATTATMTASPSSTAQHTLPQQQQPNLQQSNSVSDSPAPDTLLRPDSPRPHRLGATGPTPALDTAFAEAQPIGDNLPVPHDAVAYNDSPNDFAAADGDEKMLEVIHLDAIYSVQKMAEVLVQGPDSEREFILFELQQLLDHCLDDTMKILLPVLCEHVPTWNVDLQIKSAKRLFDVVTFQLEPVTANMITCASFGVIQAAKGKPGLEFEELYNLWGSILVDVLPNMKWTPQEIADVIAIIDIHAEERLFTSRKVAARVLGALAQCLDRSKVEKMILRRAIELFKDEDVEVRGTIVESLAFIGAALPVRITETEVWPRVERLLEPPEDARIRATAMRTMAHILQAQREKNKVCRLFRDLLPPVFARLSAFARKFSAEDQRLVDDDTYLLLEVVSEVFGQFLYTLSLCARKSFRKEAYKGYAGMATCNGPLIRRNCAFNLPGVAKALGERYALELSGLCEFLAKDTDEEVRWILAAGIHQSATLLAPRGHFEKLFTAVCSLLQDENPLVRMNALGHFHELLSAFAKDGSDPASVRRLAPVFTNLTMLSEGEWRIQRSLAEQLDKCADIIPPDSLLENVLPLLFRLMEQGTPLVREAAMKATVHALRNIPSMSDRNQAIGMFWNEAAKGPFWMRLALLDGGAAAMNVFSRQRFAELFAPKVLSLANDPVANVRIRLSDMLASMAPMCAGAPEYGKALELLRRDTDVDVLANMASHHDRTVDAFRTARETAADDQVKFRQEQEFYGIAQRSQKRTRGRLNSIRGSRGAFSRQPSLEQSSAHISVSPAVLGPTASASSPSFTSLGATPLGALSGYDDPVSSRQYHMDGTASDDESAGPGDGILSSLGSGHSGIQSIARGMASDSSNSAIVRGTSSVPVQKTSGGRPRVFQSRSKSWSLPRQVSGEGKKVMRGSDGGRAIGRVEGVKRKVGLKRKKKRRPMSTVDGYASDTNSAVLAHRSPSHSGIFSSDELLVNSREKEKFGVPSMSDMNSNSSKAYLDSDMMVDGPNSGGGTIRKSARTVSSSAMRFRSGPKRRHESNGLNGGSHDGGGPLVAAVGRSMSTEEGMRRRRRNPTANLEQLTSTASEDMSNLALSIEDSGPASHRSSVPWGRKSAKVRVGFGRKMNGSTTGHTAGGFLRTLFRKRK